MKEHQKRRVVRHAALKANVHRETASKYLKRRISPKDRRLQRPARAYRTRVDPLAKIWPEVLRYLEATPELAHEPTPALKLSR